MSALSALIVWSIVLGAGALAASPRAALRRSDPAGIGTASEDGGRARASRSRLRPRSRSPGPIPVRDPDDPPPGPRHFGPVGRRGGGDRGP